MRRAISYLIDRKALVKAILFGNGKPANSFMPPQVPYYDPKSPGLQYNVAKAKAELAKSSVPKGFTTTFEAASGNLASQTIAQVIQAAGKPLGIKVNIIKKDANAVAGRLERRHVSRHDGNSVLDDGHRRPGRARVVRRRPDGRRRQLVPDLLQQPGGRRDDARRRSASSIRPSARPSTPRSRSSGRTGRIHGVPLLLAVRYAYSTKLQGFQVYPTGNYHMEDVWLQK